MATHLSASHWLVGVPNELGSAKATLDRFSAALATKGNPADVSVWDVPAMKVGTLDSLLSLADDLGRADSFAEGVVRKVERQVAESYAASKLAELPRTPAAATASGNNDDGGRSAAVNIPALQFRAGGLPVGEFVRKFAWDSEQYDPKEPLPDLVRRLVSAGEKVDADVRAYGAAYGEKRTALTAMERRRAGNLMVCGLEEIVTPAALEAAGAEFVPADSEYLSTVVIVVPRTAEEAFVGTYERMDPEAVPMGNDPADREAVRGSPVVPRSCRRVAEDKDGYVLFTVTILKKFGDSFRAACRERRYAVRDFTYDPNASKSAAAAAAALEVDVAAALAALREASGRKYTEAVSVWLHVKAVRMFVECVLRFGLPVNFVAVLVKVNRGSGSGGAPGRRTIEAVNAAWRTISGPRGGYLDDAYGAGDGGKGDGSSGSSSSSGSSMVIPGVSDGSGTASFPFVFLDFDVRNDTAALSGAR